MFFVIARFGGLADGVLIVGPMTPEQLRQRTKKFAIDVVRFAKTIPKDPIDDEIAAQLTDGATATAAAYRAACRARSRADFIYKPGNAIEEVDESALWLEILNESGISGRNQTAPLWQEADELTRILVRSRETSRNNRRRGNQEDEGHQ